MDNSRVMNDLFYEVLRVAIGTQNRSSWRLDKNDWGALFQLAETQSLLGICFEAILQYDADSTNGFRPEGMDEIQYLVWLGRMAEIQQKNELQTRQCVELFERITKAGYLSCVLKGQAVASLYGSLSVFRNAGDIDIWMVSTPQDVIQWAKNTGNMYYYDYHHADIHLFENTEVELHYRPSLSRNLVRNARLQKWFKTEGAKHILYKEELGFSVPDYLFNVVLTLNHNFWHLLYEGVGMRQFLDLFFVLKSRNINDNGLKDIQGLLVHLKLMKFAKSAMWIMKEVLGLEDKYLICEPDERSGKFLLDEIMLAGNFGKYDNRLDGKRYESRVKLMLSWVRHTSRLFKYYPADVLWTPIGVLRISLWRRWHNRIEEKS